MTGILFALALGATLQVAHGPSEFNKIAPRVINVAREEAAEHARPGSGRGPILLDVESFRAAARALDGEDVDSLALLRAGGTNARIVRRREGVVCAPNPRFPRTQNCEVRDDGLMVEVGRLQRTSEGVEVDVISSTTERRPSGSTGLAITTVRLSFRKQGDAWVLTDRRVLRFY